MIPRAALLASLGLLVATPAAQTPPPNFIIILADDMGYGDSSVYDGWIATPNLERMAAEGLTFTDFHSSGVVCSPTRAGLLTGRYQQRAGIPGVVNADPNHRDHHRGLQPSEVTFAELLRGAGYRTAIFGKWHLGYDPKYNPIHHGFERFRGFVSGNIDYVSHYDRMGTQDWWEGAQRVEEPGYLTHLLTEHAVRFAKHADEPFCLYLPHGAVHTPIQAPDSPAVRGPEKGPQRDPRPRREIVEQMMTALDDHVGAVLDALRDRGIAQRTLVVFASDNGGAAHMRCDPLRGKKGSVWEGGHRVPALAWWPGHIETGTVSDELAISLDLMPTLLELAGVPTPDARPLDGRSLVPLLLKGETLGRRQLFWNGIAMRDGPWKLIARRSGAAGPALFNLSEDLGETTDIAARHPDRTAEMTAALAAWREDVARGATPQPDLERFVAEHGGAPRPTADAARSAARSTRKPNIVFVLADDLGWSDVGFNGAAFYETPHIDRLAADGMIVRRAYTCGPNCAPTRGCLISGMYTPRHHIYTPGQKSKGALQHMKLLVPARKSKRDVTFPPSLAALDPGVVSFAEVLNEAGYATGHFGKWHVGPDAQGFDVSTSNGEPGKRGRHYGNINVADKLTDASIAFIERHKDEPFFVYLSHWDVHTPIRAKPDVVARYQEKQKGFEQQWNTTYAGMIEAVDKSVGRLRQRLRELGLQNDTLFVFSSDNGGLPRVSSNAPLRGGKGSLFEGGIRVPTCITWPGVVEPGSSTDVPITSVDFLPTFADLSGAPLPDSQPVDGQSLRPLLEGKDLPDRPIFWFYPLYLAGGKGNKVLPIFGSDEMYWRAVPAAAVVVGDWKLIRYFEDDSVALYDLAADVGERRNLADTRPDERERLLGHLNRWLADTQAPIPTAANPDFGR